MEEIRGLSVKFDADFSEFKKGLKDADKDINSTQRQLKTLQSSLKLEWDPKKFEQAQSLAQKSLVATEKKADLLRARLKEMENAGVTDKTRDQYNYLSEELEKTELRAKTLKQQLEDINNMKLDKLTKGIDNVANKLDQAAAATRGLSMAAAAAVAGLAAIGLKSIEKADEIATLATTYNMSTDAIQRFNYVALQTDTSADYLYKGFVKVQAGVADLSTGVTSVATKALEQLGLSFEQFDGAEDQFYAIIDALANMEDQSKMVSLANDIFGERMATNLFPLIYAGTDAVNDYRYEWEQMGALTEEQIGQLSEFDNVLNDLKTQFANVALQLGHGLLPLMQDLSNMLTKSLIPTLSRMVHIFSNLSVGTQKFVVVLLTLTAALSPTLSALASVAKLAVVLIPLFAKLGVNVLALTGKFALLAMAIGSVFLVLSNWENMNPVQRIIGLLGSLAAAALAAALAFGAFHSAWSIGLAVAGIVAGIAAATAAVIAAADEIGVDASFDTGSYQTSVDIPSYNVPSSSGDGNSVSNTSNNYVDNSNIVINIEKNDYMSEDDIIRAVNKGLKQARQSRS